MLRVVFIGDMEFGTALIEAITDSKHELIGVVNKVDERGIKALKKKVKQYLKPDNTEFLIKKNGIPVITTKGANSADFRQKLKELAPDVILISSWGEILHKETIELAKIACVNCHAALLPAHKGPAPWSSVIKQGTDETGVTFHLATEEIDSGEILLQKKVAVYPHDTSASIQAKCILLAKNTVGDLLDALEKNEISPIQQDKTKSSYFPGAKSKDGAIDWNRPASESYNHIRALKYYVPCYTVFENKKLNVISAQIIGLDTPSDSPGQILARHNNFLLVSSGDPQNALLIELADRIEPFKIISEMRARLFVDRNTETGKFLSSPSRNDCKKHSRMITGGKHHLQNSVALITYAQSYCLLL